MEIPQRNDLHRARQELATSRAGRCALRSELAAVGHSREGTALGVAGSPADLNRQDCDVHHCDRVVVTLQVSHEIRLLDLLGPVRRIVTEDFMAQPHNPTAGAPGATGIPIAPDLNLHDLNLEVQAIQRSVDQLVMDSELHRKTIERLARWLGA